MLVPVELPPRWQFDSISRAFTGGPRDYHELTFRTTDMSSDPVRLCVERVASDLCAADAEPAHVHEVGELRGVWLFPVGDRVGPTIWPAVELTDDWRSVGWISAD